VLIERLADPELERPVLYALATIATPDAMRAIEDHAANASPEGKDLIRDLKREEFRK
jgi:hypothetical protein